MTAIIHHGDFLRFAETMELRSDHVITDPPYLEHSHENQRRGGGKKPKGNVARPIDFTHLTPERRREYAHAIARLTKRWAIVFSDHEGWEGWRSDLIAAGLVYVRQLAWVRGSVDLGASGRVTRGKKGAPQFTGDRPAVGHEVMVLCHAPRTPLRWNGRGARRDGSGGFTGGGTVYYADIETEGRVHDTQKPLTLMRDLVRDFTDPGETILDPFCGSGTTNVAAKIEGRASVGIDISAKHAEGARRRVA